MTATCTAKVDVLVNGLGNEINKRVRFATTNTPEAVQVGYGTILAANTYEEVVLGQVASSLIDLVYIKSIDNTVYIESKSTTLSVADIKLAASEACCFRPGVSVAATISIIIMSGTAGANYEYIIVGQSS